MTLVIWLLRMTLLSPVHANGLVAGADMKMRLFLDQTSMRECRGRRCSVHERDAHHTRAVWAAAKRAGYIHPNLCPGHADPDAGWSTRGHLGLMAGYHWHLLPWWLQCAPPSVFDIPIVSSYVARKKAERLCRGKRICRRKAWTKRWADGSPNEERSKK